MVKSKYFKVLMEVYYEIPYHSDYGKASGLTDINGWSEDKVKEHWFSEKSLNEHHPTRDDRRKLTRVINITTVEELPSVK